MSRTKVSARSVVTWCAGLALIVLGALSVAILPDAPPASKSGDGRLRVAVWNIYFGNEVPAEAGRALVDLNTDVLVLVEWTGNNADLEPLKDAGFEFVVAGNRTDSGGVAVLARSGLVRAASVIPPPLEGPCSSEVATVRVVFADVEFNVVGVHAPPPLRHCGDGPAPSLKKFASWVDAGRATEAIGEARIGLPTIIAGDLNSFPFWAGLRELERSGLVDAYRETRWGIGPTWPTRGWLPPFARIDYVLVPEQFTVFNAWAMTIPGSDHRAVMAELAL